jgi:hypothetical protein
MKSPDRGFDKTFVVSVLIIGGVYAAIVVACDSLIGKEAAGVVGAALTAVVIAILREFETLRFHHPPKGEETELIIPRISGWLLVLFTATFLGVQLILNQTLNAVVRAANSFLNITAPPVIVTIVTVGGWAISYTLGGYLCGRTVPTRRYMYPVSAAIIGLVVFNAVTLLPIFLLERDLVSQTAYTSTLLPFGVYWLLYIATAALGARYGFRKNEYLLEVRREVI